MANPQKENGFTAIANEIIERIIKTKFNGTQASIIMTIWRYTYGFHACQGELSITFIANAIDMSKTVVKRELDKLIDRKIVLVAQENTNKKPRIIKFNKNYDEWLEDTRRSTLKSVCTKKSTLEDAKKSTLEDTKKSTNKENIKENIKEINEQAGILWEIYPNKKGKAKAITKIPNLIIKYTYKQLERCIQRYCKEIKDKNIEQQYVKHGSTFFNGGYMDYLDSNYKETNITHFPKKPREIRFKEE